VATFPANYAMFGTRTDGSGALTRNCNIINQAAGVCTADSLVSFNPLVVHSPFIDGWRENYGLSAAGGGQATTYYVAGTYNREQGVYDPNQVRRINMRANIHSQLSEKVDVTVTTNYLQSRVAFPQNDNNSEGVISGGLLGRAFETPNQGYFFVSPDKLFQLDTRQNVDRFTGGLTGNYQPLSWLKAVLQTGVDYTTRYDQFFVKPGVFAADEDPDAAVGERTSNPYQIWDYTANGSLTGSFELRPLLTSRTTLGVQYEREYLHGTEAFGENLTPGTSSLAGANALFSVGEQSSDIITLGAYASEELGWRDRVFLTGALRTDKNSAFGVDYGYVYYPAVNLSWVVGEEPFFPKTDVLSSLRLRAAYGVSGQHPRFRDAITFFSPAAVITNGSEEAGITIGGTGDPNLRPEKSGEYEFGFDAGLFKDRGNLSFTYYNKTTRDALDAQRLAPSLGVSNTRFVNLGKVRNSGVEVLLDATVVRTNPVAFDVTFNGSTTNNKLVDLGQGIEPIIFGLGGDTQRHQNGYPLGGYWQKPILSFADANGDGIIAPSEVQVGDTAVYMGTPYPRRELAITPRVTLFKYVTVSSLFDYRGGFKLYNGTEDFRCGTIRNCRAIQDKSSPLADQAAAVADAQFNTVAGYIEDATFWKLRELSVTLDAPSAWAMRAGVHGVSLTLAGRNLHTWTGYRGLDPELNEAAQANFTQADFLTQPPVRYYTARVNVTW
jgi:outer membrane receptor protein involved in Fe transport